MIKNSIPMLWNRPGDEENKENPWKSKNKEQGPPDLEQIFRQFMQNFRKKLAGGNGLPPRSLDKNEFHFFGGLFFVAILVIYLLSGIYIVDPPERAVVMRFGKYIRTEGPGPHWIAPLVESKEIVNVEQVATSEHSGLLLTRDGNIVSVSVAVQYKVGSDNNDVRSYLFKVANPVRSLNQSADSALRQVVGQSLMDEIITVKRAEIATAVKEQMIVTLKPYDTGLKVLDVVMQYARPPDEVQAAFDEVIKASADQERLVNQAISYSNQVLPKAKGNAERLRNEAIGYKEETILIAQGNIQRFNAVLPLYLKDPKVTQTRMYLDTMEQILSKVSKVVIEAGQGNNMVYLPLDKLMTGQGMGDSVGIDPKNNSLDKNNTTDKNISTDKPTKERLSAATLQKEKSQ